MLIYLFSVSSRRNRCYVGRGNDYTLQPCPTEGCLTVVTNGVATRACAPDIGRLSGAIPGFGQGGEIHYCSTDACNTDDAIPPCATGSFIKGSKMIHAVSVVVTIVVVSPLMKLAFF